jgi:hypothetical protein
MLQLPDNFREEIANRVRQHEAAFERESARFAERLRRQGREAVAAYLADSSKADELAPKDRKALAKFLAEYAPLDDLRDAGARRLSDAIVHIEAIIDLIPTPKSSWRRRAFAIAPAAIIGGAIVMGFYNPLRDASIVFCRFVARDSLGTLVEYEFLRLLTEPTLAPTLLIVIAFVICIFAGWRAFALNAVIAVVVFFGINFYAAIANAREWKVPAFCSVIDAQTGAPRAPSIEQRLRIRDALTR